MASRQTAEGASTSVGFALPVAPLGLEVSPPPSPPGDLHTLFTKHWGPPAIPWLDGEHDPLLLPWEIPGRFLVGLPRLSTPPHTVNSSNESGFDFSSSQVGMEPGYRF